MNIHKINEAKIKRIGLSKEKTFVNKFFKFT